jgi:formylglycine-generating enzyme required for sulfatase activity
MENVVGQTIADRYRVDEFLGRGGMSEVYKVWDTHRNTHLAMKLLHEDLAYDLVFLRRFKREADNLARLQHPHIIRFYGLEQDEFMAFMLMDYVEGESLKKENFRHRGKGIPSRKVANLIKPICSALGYAHRQGLVHCDLKPGNIMIDKHGKVLLADFGIARLTDAATATMVGAGTPAYMAPEQVKGLDPVPQTDIYALGVVLFEMLTGGERPFTGERAETTGTMSSKVRWEQVNLEPPSPREYNEDVSSEMEGVVLRCLAKDPEVRYQTPLRLRNALERAVATGQVEGVGALEESAPDIHSQQERSKDPSVDVQPDTSGIEAPTRLETEDIQAADTPTQSRWQRFGGWAVAGGMIMIALAVFVLSRGGNPMFAAPTATSNLTVMDTPFSTLTRTPTSTLTDTPTPTETLAPSLTPVPTLGVGSTKVSPNDGMTMVYIPAGEFMMGSEKWATNERPVHKVYLEAFWMDEHEVTCRQFHKFKDDRRYKMYSCWHGEDHPVSGVNWEDAREYCEWVGRRLPTEAEWEKAARGGLEGKLYPWGDQAPVCEAEAENGAQFSSCGNKTVPVKSFPSNAYGLYDMAGNVWEWVADWYDDDYYDYSPREDPQGPLNGAKHMLRGGSFLSDANIIRVADRSRSKPIDSNFYDIGFRCVSSAP